jgi:hypothetical protein
MDPSDSSSSSNNNDGSSENDNSDIQEAEANDTRLTNNTDTGSFRSTESFDTMTAITSD